jgi:hypothetical protein
MRVCVRLFAVTQAFEDACEAIHHGVAFSASLYVE